jgi:hypothetical protein
VQFPLVRHDADTGEWWMARYFVHVEDEEIVLLDRAGIELPDTTDPAEHCRKTVAAVLRKRRWREIVSGDFRLSVVDECGRTIWEFAVDGAPLTPGTLPACKLLH